MSLSAQCAPPGPLNSAAVQIVLLCLLSLLEGGIIPINVFTLSVERAARTPHALDNVWEPAMSAIYFLFAPFAVLCALLLDGSRDKHRAVQRAVSLAAAGFLCFALAAPGVLYGARPAIVTGVVALSVPLGLLAVVKIELLTAWLPHAMGVAVGLSTSSCGAGALLWASLYDRMLAVLPVTQCIPLLAAVFAAFTVLIGMLLRVPPPPPLPSREDDDLQEPLCEKFTWRTMLRSRNFWLYSVSCTAISAGFAIHPYFFKLGAVYGAAEPVVLRWYQAGTALSMLFNLTTATLCDFARWGAGALRSGPRNVVAVLLATQTVLLGSLHVGAGDMAFMPWACHATFVRLCHIAGFNLYALLAADLFGRANASLVVGIGEALSLGVGDGVAGLLMLVVDRVSGARGTPAHYAPYYAVGAVWSVLALCALLALRKLRQRECAYV